jgi:WXG100 family type VII secretion target
VIQQHLVRFDVASIDDLIDRLATASANIEDILDVLDQRVAVLCANWSGEASLTYRTAHAQWTLLLRELNDALVKARGLASAHSAGYAEAESKIGKLFD